MKDIKELLNFSLINIDKPAGPTSFSVSEFVRKKLGLSKTSHMGTLDPKVTGVLPITLGRACKLAGYFIRHDKTYVGVLETHRECVFKKTNFLIWSFIHSDILNNTKLQKNLILIYLLEQILLLFYFLIYKNKNENSRKVLNNAHTFCL